MGVRLSAYIKQLVLVYFNDIKFIFGAKRNKVCKVEMFLACDCRTKSCDLGIVCMNNFWLFQIAIFSS